MSALIPDLAWWQARMIQDAMSEAMASTWLRRAATFEAAAPRRGDFHGKASQDELRDRYDRCMAAAAACRHHAELVGMRDQEIAPDVYDALAEVA